MTSEGESPTNKQTHLFICDPSQHKWLLTVYMVAFCVCFNIYLLSCQTELKPDDFLLHILKLV